MKLGQAFALGLLVLGVVLAGCTGKSGPSGDDCRDATCPPITGGGPGGDLPLPNATRPTIQLVGCKVESLVLLVPIENVDALVPSAFHVLEAFSAATAGIVLWLSTCDRTLNETQVFESGHALWVFAFVEPTNSSWSQSGFPNYYMIHATSDVVDLVGALRNASASAETGSFSVTSLASPSGHEVEQWNVEMGSASLAFAIPRLTSETQAGGVDAHVWTGTGPFHRAQYQRAGTEVTVQNAGEILATGSAGFVAALPLPLYPFIGSSYTGTTFVIEFDGIFSEDPA